LFKPESVDERVWGRLLSKVEEISGREKVDHDVCLIGSHARGDASPDKRRRPCHVLRR